jgi:hypothetical protein
MLSGTKVTTKWGRCLSFTLPSGEVIDVKVLGEKDAAKAASAKLLAALTATK